MATQPRSPGTSRKDAASSGPRGSCGPSPAPATSRRDVSLHLADPRSPEQSPREGPAGWVSEGGRGKARGEVQGARRGGRGSPGPDPPPRKGGPASGRPFEWARPLGAGRHGGPDFPSSPGWDPLSEDRDALRVETCNEISRGRKWTVPRPRGISGSLWSSESGTRRP